MKIRTQFIISTVTFTLFLLLISVSVIVTNQKIGDIHQQGLLATQIEREAYELGYLANDYLLYRESQQAGRWESKFASFSKNLSSMDVSTPEQQALLAKIEDDQQRLKTVFAEVSASIESAPQIQEAGVNSKFMQVSWSRLEVQNQGIIFEASRLTQMLREQEDQLRRVTSLLGFVLIGVLGIFLFGSYGLTFRRILLTISTLQAGTRIIGSGDLDFAIAVKNEDEIGELSRAFNQMTSNLKQVTASKADLEKEIMERKQAEGALLASRRAAINLMEDALNAQEQVKQVNASLFESERKFSVIFEKAGFAAALSKPPEGILVDVNEAWVTIFGYTKQEAIGRTTLDLNINPDAQGRARILAQLRETGSARNVETALRTKSGEWRNFVMTVDMVDIGGQQYILNTVQDITERKRAEVELVRLASFPEKNPNPIVEIEYSSDIVYMNPRCRELFPDIASAGLKHPLLTGLEQHIETFKAEGLETHQTREVKVGEVYCLQTIVNIPESRRIRLYNMDITKRKQAEEALRRSEVLLLETGRMAKIGGWELDLRTMRPAWSLETYRIHEVDPSIQPELDSAINFYASEARSQLTEAVRCAMEEGQPYDLELPLITAKGRDIWVRTMGQPEFRDGRCVRLYGTFQDITERKQAEEGLRRFELLSAHSKDIILFMRRDDGHILEVNAAAIQVYGYSRDELLALRIGDLRAQGTQSLTADQMAQADTTGILFETVHLRKDGSTFPVEVSSQGATIGGVRTLISVVRDITERKKDEETLARQAEDLRHSNTELEQFAYVASHDLQEPLRIMSSYSQLLERRYKGRLDQDADEFIAFIVDAASRMQKLITDLLAYSRAGHGNTDMVEVDCDRLVRRLVESMAFTIESAEGLVTHDRLPSIIAHETSLVQLFQNLIGNALKFRGEQPPRVHISARQVDNEWVFSVADNGIGIEPQYSQRIFMIFQRLHARDKYPGTGIGLSICKKIVENLGGRIWVESEPGQGTTFTFTVPVRKNSG